MSKGLFCHFDKGLVLDEEELNRFSLPWRYCVKLIIQLRNIALVLKLL